MSIYYIQYVYVCLDELISEPVWRCSKIFLQLGGSSCNGGLRFVGRDVFSGPLAAAFGASKESLQISEYQSHGFGNLRIPKRSDKPKKMSDTLCLSGLVLSSAFVRCLACSPHMPLWCSYNFLT